MGLADRFSLLVVTRRLLAAVDQHNALMQEVVDELRIARGAPTRYAAPPDRPAAFAGEVIDGYDFSVDETLRAYARGQGIAVDDLTDIRAVASDRGWMDEDGQVRVGRIG